MNSFPVARWRKIVFVECYTQPQTLLIICPQVVSYLPPKVQLIYHGEIFRKTFEVSQDHSYCNQLCSNAQIYLHSYFSLYCVADAGEERKRPRVTTLLAPEILVGPAGASKIDLLQIVRCQLFFVANGELGWMPISTEIVL